MDYYQTLGVPKNAGKEEIKKAFRKLAHQYHPDKQGGNEQKFKEINEAYQVLSDDQKRSQYDTFGSAFDAQGGGSGASGFDFGGFGRGGFSAQGVEFDLNDIFSDLFGGGRGRTATKTRQRGQDIQVDMEISLQDAYQGFEKDISLKKYVRCHTCNGDRNEPGTQLQTCSTCQGTGEIRNQQQTILGSFMRVAECRACKGVGKIPDKKCRSCNGNGRVQDTELVRIKIPAGIASGEAISLKGKGEMGEAGEAGDLYIRVLIKSHPEFERNGDNIHSERIILFSQAILGDQIQVQTLGGTVSARIPDGIQSGELLKLPGKGMPNLAGRGQGDHYIKIIVKTPEKLSKRAKDLMEELRKEGL
jgi:molecular chaperone DnaJ